MATRYKTLIYLVATMLTYLVANSVEYLAIDTQKDDRKIFGGHKMKFMPLSKIEKKNPI
jgi:hypothetical protein